MIIKEQMENTVSQMGEITGMKEMRKHFAWYLKGVPGASQTKAHLMTCTTQSQALEILSGMGAGSGL
jgi:tRNA-dihydrouridine synthase